LNNDGLDIASVSGVITDRNMHTEV